MRKKILISLALPLFVTLGITAAEIERPLSRQATSFAIVVDKTTLQMVRTEIDAYKRSLEADGLSTYVVSSDWESPHEVRDELAKLYSRTPNLEGVVLIGDIPVVLVRNAQHLTTAFKMNEEAFPRERSSVPSDRFYDDLNLRFEFIGVDTIRTGHFYYRLAPDSPQRVNPTFYSGRIRFPEGKPGDKYEEIAGLLRKIVRERELNTRLDHLVTYAGSNYNSDCITAWMDEGIAVEEQFPYVGGSSSSLRRLHFRMNDFMKFSLLDQLARPELDMAIFNEHGSYDKQHVNGDLMGTNVFRMTEIFKEGIYSEIDRELRKKDGDPEGARRYFMEKYSLSSRFFDLDTVELRRARDSVYNKNIVIDLDDLEGFATQPRFVVFNSCYNGSFHREGNIAASYLFNPGRTVAVQGNTVNVLQDRWTYRYIGLLSHGLRVGQWNRLTPTLECHILGDPAFRFRSDEYGDIGTDIVLLAKDHAYWRSLLDAPSADVRSVALRMLTDNHTISSAELLDIMFHSPYAVTRLECLTLLSRFRDDNFIRAIARGLEDEYEQTRRQAVVYAWKTGDQRLIEDIARVYVYDTGSARVWFNLQKSVLLFPSAKMAEAIIGTLEGSGYPDKPERIERIRMESEKNDKTKKEELDIILDPNRPIKTRVSAIRAIRNNTYHENVDHYMRFLEDSSQPMELRVMMAEALGWFEYSVRRAEILARCERLARNRKMDKDLRAELTETINRLK